MWLESVEVDSVVALGREAWVATMLTPETGKISQGRSENKAGTGGIFKILESSCKRENKGKCTQTELLAQLMKMKKSIFFILQSL